MLVGGRVMVCPICKKNMKDCGEVRIISTQPGGLLDAMCDIHKADYKEQYTCENCGHTIYTEKESK